MWKTCTSTHTHTHPTPKELLSPYSSVSMLENYVTIDNYNIMFTEKNTFHPEGNSRHSKNTVQMTQGFGSGFMCAYLCNPMLP